MSQQKQILLIEELGTPKTQFEKNIKQSKLNYEIIWEKSAATKEKVEVLVMVKQKLDKRLPSTISQPKMIVVAFTGYDCRYRLLPSARHSYLQCAKLLYQLSCRTSHWAHHRRAA